MWTILNPLRCSLGSPYGVCALHEFFD
jgi:hypothetical protein